MMSQTRSRRVLTVLGLAAVLGTTTGPALGGPITMVPNTANMLRDTRGINNVGIGAGNAVQYGADLQGGSLGTNIGAVHPSGVSDPPGPCSPLAVNPNFCANAFGFDASRLSGWTIKFTKGANSLDVPAPSLVGAEAPVPFPVSVTITAGATPTTPTISWTIPGGFTLSAFRVNVFDVDGPSLPNGTQNVIHSVAVPPASTSYTLPSTLSSGASLQLGHNYSINFQVIVLRSGFTEADFLSTNRNAMILNRSNSYFAFQPLDASAPPDVHLPQVGPDPDPNDGFGAPYVFHIESVGPDNVTFIDPIVAVGYDYATGPGDPHFASVLLPNVGDGVYDVIFDGIHHTVLAGQQFFFPQGGVTAFSVRGIEVSTGLDPKNVVAFITGLTFVSHGAFTGSMTPIVELVATFADVVVAHPFFAWIEALVKAGITRGCASNPPQYCPDAEVTRSQMAVLLLRAIHGPAYQPPTATGTMFTDVPLGEPFADWIEQLAKAGITGGCSSSPPQYCPEAAVTRAEMAVFLLRAKHGAGFQPPAATGMFADVLLSDPFVPWIEQLAREGITGGCAINPAQYCPDQPVTRGQVAVFLARAFGLLP